MINMRSNALLLVTVLLLAGGCAPNVYRTYPGPARPDSEVARIADKQRVFIATLRSVDGEPIKDKMWDVLETTPGTHTLAMDFRWDNGYREALELTVTVEAGGRYELMAVQIEPQKSIGEKVFWEFAEGMGPLVGPVIAPFALAGMLANGKPRAGPAGHMAVVSIDLPNGREVARWTGYGAKPAPR